MTEPLEQLNPADEERYLVSLLVNTTTRRLAEEALTTVDPDDFASAAWAGLWDAARKLTANDTRITRRALVAAADSPGAEHALWRLGDTMPEPAHYPAAVAEVRRCGALRRLLEATQRIQQRALAAEDISDAHAAAYHELDALTSRDDHGGTRSYAELLDAYVADLSHPTRSTVVPTPWDEINDHIAGGLHGGRMYVVGARTGDGKSIIGHNLGEHAASAGYPALVFSAEMGTLEVTGRTIANGATIDLGELNRRALTQDSWQRLNRYTHEARDYPLYVDDRAELTLGYIKSEARAQQRRTGLAMIVVDYLQLLRADRRLPREQQVAEISRGLKQLSRELGVAVVVPAQLNRKSLERDKPTKADLRESGAIEHDSDVVLLLARQQFPADSDMAGRPNNMIDVIIDKNRHGRDNLTITLPFRGQYARIG